MQKGLRMIQKNLPFLQTQDSLAENMNGLDWSNDNIYFTMMHAFLHS